MTTQKSNSDLVAQWKKNQYEVVRVQLDTYRGRRVIDIRAWYRNDEGKLRPAPRGITLDIKHFPELAKAVKKIGKRLQTQNSKRAGQHPASSD